MKKLRLFLIFSTLIIYGLTVLVAVSHGVNWPAVAIHDVLALNWRSQFNTDFIFYLLMFAVWVAWREGFTARAYIFGFLSVIMGGMFGFPYLLYASYVAKGKPSIILLGNRADLA